MDGTTLLYTVLTIAGVIGFLQGMAGMQVWLERKLSAWLQDRHGPNRVGPFGLFQSLADGLKFILKEELLPGNVDKTLYLLAPMIGLTTATLAFAVVPFGDTSVPSLGHNPGYQFVIAPNIDIGFLFIFAASSITVYAVILAGWAANNKYSFIGGLRSSAQIVSYEIPMGMSILGIVLVSGSLNLERIIERQVNPEHSAWWLWNVVQQPLPCLIFMIACFAECNRMPFDLPECEQELVGGYHTEYGAMKLAMLLMGEYTHMVTTSFLMAILFFGGWHFPLIAEVNSPWFMKVFVFAVKMGAFISFYMLVRWTILRFRFDQLMGLAWKVLIPMTMVYLLCVMIVVELDKQWGWKNSTWLLLPISLLILVGAAWLALLMPKGHERAMPRRIHPVEARG
ncbi:MAG TPA: NADH-quinone oxidoreductase subunit NuoH [Gemmataceae bacterium]|nr:NADH-quinone oxidoreductase subunit NuoH [Gemmataceae bacterium]